MLDADLERELRAAINPAYEDMRGTESFERKRMLGEIDRLRASIKKWVDARNAPVTGMFGIAERDALLKAENELENAL